MPTKIRIKITQEILQQSALCPKQGYQAMTNCAFALAVRDILPNAYVFYEVIRPFGCPNVMGMYSSSRDCDKIHQGKFVTTPTMRDFISRFDDSSYSERLLMKGEEFELEIPDWVVDELAQQEVDFVQAVLNSPTLELV